MATFTPLDADALASLSGFSGALIGPGDPQYDETRKIHNGLIDKRPLLIARCRGTADIVDALALARDHGLDVSVRGGGHNVAGRAVSDGGVMIDLSLMKGIHVDPATRTARAQGGVTWGEFNRETAIHGLATTGGVVSTTGIAGLTLGGGFGWLMAKHGLATDHVVSVELVTAAGEVLNVSADEYPDLFWALRGGGGNFGVAASFLFRTYPLRRVFGGIVAHPFPAAHEVLRFVRDASASFSDELTVVAALTHAPDGSGLPLVAFALCHCGTDEQSAREVRPLLEFGEPVLQRVDTMPYPVMNTLLDANYPWGMLSYWKSSFLRTLSDEAIDAMIDSFATCPSPMTAIILEHVHGAVTRVGVSETAVPHREAGFDFLVTSVWSDPATTTDNIAWTRSTYRSLEPFFATRRYVNYLDGDESSDAVRSAYGPNYARLVEVKRRYDPANLFRLNQNIVP
ncbi:MAG TPA: FAD-binding oxidoreductase [Candidatus Acidoferrum sp.]|jgi:FAD/FMN-containing dehydrogenase|nr:FAD-binding oxidoreductase [Candidatus Acidoferrum sp.]